MGKRWIALKAEQFLYFMALAYGHLVSVWFWQKVKEESAPWCAFLTEAKTPKSTSISLGDFYNVSYNLITVSITLS